MELFPTSKRWTFTLIIEKKILELGERVEGNVRFLVAESPFLFLPAFFPKAIVLILMVLLLN